MVDKIAAALLPPTAAAPRSQPPLEAPEREGGRESAQRAREGQVTQRTSDQQHRPVTQTGATGLDSLNILGLGERTARIVSRPLNQPLLFEQALADQAVDAPALPPQPQLNAEETAAATSFDRGAAGPSRRGVADSDAASVTAGFARVIEAEMRYDPASDLTAQPQRESIDPSVPLRVAPEASADPSLRGRVESELGLEAAQRRDFANAAADTATQDAINAAHLAGAAAGDPSSAGAATISVERTLAHTLQTSPTTPVSVVGDNPAVAGVSPVLDPTLAESSAALGQFAAMGQALPVTQRETLFGSRPQYGFGGPDPVAVLADPNGFDAQTLKRYGIGALLPTAVDPRPDLGQVAPVLSQTPGAVFGQSGQQPGALDASGTAERYAFADLGGLSALPQASGVDPAETITPIPAPSPFIGFDGLEGRIDSFEFDPAADPREGPDIGEVSRFIPDSGLYVTDPQPLERGAVEALDETSIASLRSAERVETPPTPEVPARINDQATPFAYIDKRPVFQEMEEDPTIPRVEIDTPRFQGGPETPQQAAADPIITHVDNDIEGRISAPVAGAVLTDMGIAGNSPFVVTAADPVERVTTDRINEAEFFLRAHDPEVLPLVPYGSDNRDLEPAQFVGEADPLELETVRAPDRAQPGNDLAAVPGTPPTLPQPGEEDVDYPLEAGGAFERPNPGFQGEVNPETAVQAGGVASSDALQPPVRLGQPATDDTLPEVLPGAFDPTVPQPGVLTATAQAAMAPTEPKTIEARQAAEFTRLAEGERAVPAIGRGPVNPTNASPELIEKTDQQPLNDRFGPRDNEIGLPPQDPSLNAGAGDSIRSERDYSGAVQVIENRPASGQPTFEGPNDPGSGSGPISGFQQMSDILRAVTFTGIERGGTVDTSV